MRPRFFYVRNLATFDTQKIDVNAHKGLAHDIKATFRQQTMDIGHTAIGRVFYGHHRGLSIALAHRIHRFLKACTGQHIPIGACFAAGLVRIGTKLSLKGDAAWVCGGSHNKSFRWAFCRASYTLPSYVGRR